MMAGKGLEQAEILLTTTIRYLRWQQADVDCQSLQSKEGQDSLSSWDAASEEQALLAKVSDWAISQGLESSHTTARLRGTIAFESVAGVDLRSLEMQMSPSLLDQALLARAYVRLQRGRLVHAAEDAG